MQLQFTPVVPSSTTHPLADDLPQRHPITAPPPAAFPVHRTVTPNSRQQELGISPTPLKPLMELLRASVSFKSSSPPGLESVVSPDINL
jgi:hypothetical protein